MPLRRSPPTPSVSSASGTMRPTPTICPPDTCESDTASERSCSGNVSVRMKRKRDDDDIKDLKSLITCLSMKVDQNFLEIKQSNEELKESLQFISDRYDAILKALQTLQEERVEDKKKIQKLEEKIEVLERRNRSANIEIRNVPVHLQDKRKFESKEDASTIVKNLSRAVAVDIQDADIKDIYRIPSHKEGAKPILIELNSVLKKDRLLQAVKNFNKNRAGGDKLNTGHLNIPGPIKPIFISEDLTPSAKKLFYVARQFAREHNYSYCWTSRGVIYLRKAEGEPQAKIESEISLKGLVKK